MDKGTLDSIRAAVCAFELIIKTLKDCHFSDVAGAPIFHKLLITELRQRKSQNEHRRRKKLFGSLIGKAAGILGGALVVTGLAFAPATLGASGAISGVGIFVLAAGIGSSLLIYSNEELKERGLMTIMKDSLEKFVIFQKSFVIAMALIVVCEKQIATIKDTEFVDLKFMQKEEMEQAIVRLLEEVNTLFSTEKHNRRVIGKCHDILRCARTTADVFKSNILDQIQANFTSERISFFVDQFQEAENNPFNILLSYDLSYEGNDTCTDGTTFYAFAKRCLCAKNMTVYTSSNLPAGLGLDNAGNLVAKGKVIGGRTVLRFSDTIDGHANVIGNVLRIARAVSLAAIVLEGMCVAVDVGFLGYTRYDLKKEDQKTVLQALVDLADLMEEINESSRRGSY